jgi:hypothetical protein
MKRGKRGMLAIISLKLETFIFILALLQPALTGIAALYLLLTYIQPTWVPTEYYRYKTKIE